MTAIVFGTVSSWLLIALGIWLGFQLVRQNGRLLLRLETIEKRLAHTAVVDLIDAGVPKNGSVPVGGNGDRSLARSRLNRNGLKAGVTAPDFRLPRVDGGELSLADLRGGRVLLVFSDPDCGPCDELAPRLQEIHLQRPDFQVLVVSRRDVEANRAKVTALGLTFAIVLQKSWEISMKYAKFATPIGYLIDEQGILASDLAVGVGPILALVGEPNHESRDVDAPLVARQEHAWANGKLSRRSEVL
jgi:peroxiredoxin